MDIKEYWDKQDWDESTFSYEANSIMEQIQSSSSSAMSQLRGWLLREWILCLIGANAAIMLAIFKPEVAYIISAIFIGGSFIFNGVLLSRLLIRYHQFDISTHTVLAIKNVLSLFKEFGRIQKKTIPLIMGLSAVGGVIIGFLFDDKSSTDLVDKWYTILLMATLIGVGWKYGYKIAKFFTPKSMKANLNVLKENLKLLEEENEAEEESC
ncbi:MAG: hypothetical protein AAGC85_23085 [Bacteroidota bacterium]